MTTRPPLEPEADEDEFLPPPLATDPPQEPESPTGPLPRFPSSRSIKTAPPTTTPTPPPAPPEGPPPGPSAAGPSGPIYGRSSPAFTEPSERDTGPSLAAPEDLRAAVRQAADIGFVLVGQGAGAVHSRVSRQPKDAERWIPTPTERKRVLEPASRIAARHITNDVVTKDTIDGCLVAAGVGAFAMRAVFEVDPLPEIEDTDK